MPQFRFVARKADGKLIDGVLTCNDRSAAILEVEKQGGVPIKIEPVAATASTTKSESSKSGKSAKPAPTAPADAPTPTGPVTTLATTQQYLFTEQLAHLLTAG